jgi:prophage antirepressor-like protein
MDALQSFVFNDSSHDVQILRDENGDPLFRASDIGQVLSICNVRSSISEFDEDDKVVHAVDTPGGKQEALFLTEKGVLKFVMRSRKPIAKPFQNWVFDVIKTIRKTGKYELQKEIDQIKDKHDQQLKDSEKLFREYKDDEEERIHKTLVEGYENKTVVYFGKITTMEDGRLLVKIGCTKNIRPRATALKKEFGSISIFKIFECERQEEFESFLHHHPDIRRYAHREMINGLKRSQEVFCMNDEQVKRALNIATRKRMDFGVNNKRDREDCIRSMPEFREVCEKVGVKLNEDVDAAEVEPLNKRGRCTLTGPKIQAYTEDGKDLVQTYETILDASRSISLELNTKGDLRSGIRRACENKIVRYGYRWAQLDRSNPDDTVQDIGATIPDNPIRKGLVAGMNEDKSRVMKIYTSYKDCGIENGFRSQGAVQKRSNRGEMVGGHHIVSWSDVPESIQNEWLETNTLPEIASNATCIRINRLDPVTRKVLRTYGTMNEVKAHFRMGACSLRSAIAGDLVKHGFKWAYAE